MYIGACMCCGELGMILTNYAQHNKYNTYIPNTHPIYTITYTHIYTYIYTYIILLTGHAKSYVGYALYLVPVLWCGVVVLERYITGSLIVPLVDAISILAL